MRLLTRDSSGRIIFTKDLADDDLPRYAILSHTWGAAYDEVTFEDIVRGNAAKKLGYVKVKFCIEQAERDGIRHCWVDTCCIDRRSSVELAESINSMFRWYKNAETCYAYLSDVPQGDFVSSRWFRRGWTLQELLAPPNVSFFDSTGRQLGTKTSLEQEISAVTGIPVAALRSTSLAGFTIAERLSWQSDRTTTVPEDLIYSTLGLCDVFLPICYGEGVAEAQRRLESAIFAAGSRPQKSSNVPFRSNPAYVERPELSNQILTCLKKPGGRAALVGLGGIGKSALAIDYARTVRQLSPQTWVFWIHASSAARFEDGVREASDLIKLYGREDPKANVLQLFSEWLHDASNGRWLIVLDNADDVNFLLEPVQEEYRRLDYIPVTGHGSVLVTTRSKRAAQELVGAAGIIEVDQMSKREAKALLAGQPHGENAAEAVEAKKRVLGVEHPDTLRSMGNLAATYQIQGLRKEAERLQGMLLKTSREVLEAAHPDTLTSMNNLASPNSSEGQWKELKEIELKIMVIRMKLADLPPAERSMGNLAATYLNLGQWAEIEKLQVEVMETSRAMLGLQHPDTLRSMSNLAMIYECQRQWKKAEALRTEVMETNKAVLGLQHPDTLRSMSNLAMIYDCQRQWKEAEALRTEVMETNKAVLGLQHPDTLRSIGNLASTYQDQERWNDAEALGTTVMETSRAVLGLQHPDTLRSMSSLATTYRKQGRWLDAESLDITVTETPEIVPGAHVRLETLYNDAGDALEDALSYASSIFSEISMASSASSVSSLFSPGDEIIQRLTRSVFCTQELSPLIAAAIKDDHIGWEKLERNMRRMISAFGKDLKQECRTNSQDELRTASLLQRRYFSAVIARDILTFCEARSNDDSKSQTNPENGGKGTSASKPNQAETTNPEEHGDYQSEASDDDSDEDDEQKNLTGNNGPDFDAIERFLLDCRAYNAFRLKLIEFTHRPYEARIHMALHQHMPNTWNDPLRSSLKAFRHEILWVPTHLISFSSNEKLPIFDKLKIMIEDTMGEKWDWWPLSPPKYPLQNGHCRVKWRTPCGEQQYIDIPETMAQSLKEVISTAPIFVNDAATFDITPPDSQLAANSEPSHTGTNTASVPPVPPNSAANQSQTSPKTTKTSGSVSGVNHSVVQTGIAGACRSSYRAPQAPVPRHVFLCVRRGLARSTHSLIVGRTDRFENDAHFYTWLKSTYKGVRGPLSQIFSPWRYDCCAFYRFYKRYETKPTKEDFPADDDHDYDFNRPLEDDWRPPFGPIVDIDFRHNYYGCAHHCHSWHKHRYLKSQRHSREDIQKLPQRTFCIDLDDEKQEIFWGLYAREKRAFAWILAYGVLINVPGTFFFFMWLFGWGHSADLQDAVVPLTFSFSLTTLFVGLIYESREGKS